MGRRRLTTRSTKDTKTDPVDPSLTSFVGGSMYRLARLVAVRLTKRQRVFRRRLLDEDRRLETERLGHVLDLRQIAQIVQAEADQELFRRRVHERPADDLLAPDDFDEVTLEERVEHAGGVDAADVGDLERRDRLTIRDDGERLEPRHGELLRRTLLKQPPHPLVKIRARDVLVPAGHFDELQAAGPVVVLLQ